MDSKEGSKENLESSKSAKAAKKTLKKPLITFGPFESFVVKS